MDLEKTKATWAPDTCHCATCENDPELEMNLENPVKYTCHCATCTLDPEAVSDLEGDESDAELEDESEAESPTTSDEDFIVSDSEMEEVSQEDSVEDQIDLLFESFVNLQEEQKILKKELQKQSCLLFEIHQELKKITPAK